MHHRARHSRSPFWMLVLALLAGLLTGSPQAWAVIYTWNQTGTAAWTTPTNWTPTRTVAAASDDLVFDNGATTTATGVPTQTILGLHVTTGTSATLQPATGLITLSIVGGGLTIDPGTALNCSGGALNSNRITILCGAATGAALGGNITFTGGQHQIDATTAGAINFFPGSVFTYNPATGAGNPFSATGAPGSVVFSGGSTYIQANGANPFGLAQPNSKVVFMTGSLFKFTASAGTPSFSGRTYANFEFAPAVAFTATGTGGSALSVDDVTVTAGTLNMNMAGALNLKGNISVAPGAALGFSPVAVPLSGLAFNGATSQSITNAGTLTFGANMPVTMNNAAGLSLNNDVTWNNAVTLTAGKVITGANKLILGSTSGTITGASSASYVQGNLDKPVVVSAGSFAQTYEVGDATTYAPVALASDSPAPGPSGRVTAWTTTNDHPQIATSPIDGTKSVNRYWTLTNAGLGFGTYAATFSFADPGDLDGGANVANFDVARYTGASWFTTTTGARTATSTQATGVTSFSDFQVGESSAPSWSITAIQAPNGSVTPIGITIVPNGGSQTYTITAAACYHVADVFVDGVSVGATNSYTFSGVTANHTISASFAIDTYTITASAGAGGSISPSGAVSVNCGSSQTFTITPAACFTLLDVRVDGVSVGAQTSYTFTNVVAGHTIDASFVAASYTIFSEICEDPIAAAAGGGTLQSLDGGTITPAGAQGVACGDDLTFTITPDPCYRIVDVQVDAISIGTPTSYTFTSVQANHNICAKFAIDTYTIVSSAGAGGSISPAGTRTVNCGTDQTFTITPDPCYAISDVLVDGISQGPIGSYTFTSVGANHTIAASFVQTTYTITAQVVNGHGQISPDGAVAVNCGADQTFTLTADDCYHVLDIVVDGAHVGPAPGYTFTNVQANHTIEAYFAINTYTIAATSGPNGTINPIGLVPVDCGDSRTFSFIADLCYVAEDVIVDGVSLGPVASYTFTNVTANHTIHVTWALATYTITAAAGAGGAIAPAGAVSVNCGADQTFIITPDPCFQIADVQVDNVSVGPVASYAFSNVTANHTIAATFVQQAYTITATAGPNGGIAPSGAVSVPCGGTANFVITPNPGFAIDDVLVDAVSVGAVPNYTFTSVAANHTIHATFRDVECPAVTVTAPNGGETFIIGMAANITWTATDNVGVACVDLLLSRTGAGGPYTPLVSCIANLGTYAWTVTGPATTNAVIRVVARDPAGNECYDDSNAEFSIINFVVPVLLSQFQANPVDAGVELRWTMTDNTMFARTGIERAAAASGPFLPLAATVRVENGQSVLLDREVAVGQTYFYRISGLTRSGQIVNFQPLSAIAGLPVTEFALPVISPNPIHGVAQINFSVPRESQVRVTVVDIQGRPVATLADGRYTAGRYQVSWGGNTESGAAPSGIYFIRLDAPTTKLVQRVVLVH